MGERKVINKINLDRGNKKGQITIFVIIAIIIVAAILIFFAVRAIIGNPNIVTSEFSPVYEYFDTCIQESTKEALSIAGSQGGYIVAPEFVPGTEYAPFSNKLDYVGIGVPYWYYLSGNGVVKQQVPSKKVMENQISDFLAVELTRCDFTSFREQGIIIDTNNPSVNVNILDNEVQVKVNMDLSVEKTDSNDIKSTHNVKVKSKFGKFYKLALEVYNKETKDAFLENYSVDVLYNYAPVTGSEISCSPLIWQGREVANDLRDGLSANIQALKIKNKDYKLKNDENKYFIVDLKSDESIRFLYEKHWPSKIEVWPAENSLLVAEPIGLEQGVGVIGFCYVPYHFVYDISYPVLVQIYNSEEIFQFPMSVIVDKSVPRQAIKSFSIDEGSSLDEFCDYKNTQVEVYTFNSNLDPVEAGISFSCLNEKCNIGRTKISGNDALLIDNFPQCINGIIEAKADGYVTSQLILSTNNPGVANIILDKLYELNLELVVGGLPLESRDSKSIATVSFKGDRYSTTVVYPQQKTVKLAEGLYNVSVQAYSGSALTIPGSSERQCVDVAAPGILGFFGKKNEQCFNIALPAQTLGNALSAGGNSQEFVLESDLRSSRGVKVSVPLLPPPLSFDQLQQNYELLEVQNLNVEFR